MIKEIQSLIYTLFDQAFEKSEVLVLKTKKKLLWALIVPPKCFLIWLPNYLYPKTLLEKKN